MDKHKIVNTKTARILNIYIYIYIHPVHKNVFRYEFHSFVARGSILSLNIEFLYKCYGSAKGTTSSAPAY